VPVTRRSLRWLAAGDPAAYRSALARYRDQRRRLWRARGWVTFFVAAGAALAAGAWLLVERLSALSN